MSSRQALFLHRQALTEQLKEAEDPALILHLTSVLLFQASTHCMLHAPGRCVPQIIGTLTGRIPTVCPDPPPVHGPGRTTGHHAIEETRVYTSHSVQLAMDEATAADCGSTLCEGNPYCHFTSCRPFHN